MRLRRLDHAVLLSALVVGACGGGEGPGARDPSSTPPAPTGAPGEPAVPGPETPPGTPAHDGQPARPMKPLAASTMVADLRALGLDVDALPPLDKIPPDKLRQVMKTFAKSLGTPCAGCHDENDFRAPTKNKRIAVRMWDDFVRGLATDDGSPLYCDSCHAGQKEPLDRHDKRALAAWMDANLVARLKRTDGEDHSCETCHGDPFEPDIFSTWLKTK
jgi:hypothetical protein